MSSQLNEQKLSEIWLEDATSDLYTAKSIMQNIGIWYASFFYARLAAEKALKSLCYHFQPTDTSTIIEHNLQKIYNSRIAQFQTLEHLRHHMVKFNDDHTLCRYINNATKKTPRDRYDESLAQGACSAAGSVIDVIAKIVRPSGEMGEVLYISTKATTPEATS